jgi:hypothetical protein
MDEYEGWDKGTI